MAYRKRGYMGRAVSRVVRGARRVVRRMGGARRAYGAIRTGVKAARMVRKRFNRPPPSRPAKRQRVDTTAAGGQWYRRYKKTGRAAMTISKMVNMSKHNITTCSRCVKSFDNNGFVLADRFIAAGGVTLLPVYALALNGNLGDSFQFGHFRRLCINNANNASGLDGSLFWRDLEMQNNAGVSSYTGVPYLYKGNSTDHVPKESLIFRGTDIKMNLWGARQKAIRFTVQLCTLKDHRSSPFSVPENVQIVSNAQQCYEEMIKQYTFNPISQINWSNTKDIKILRTFDEVIQPVESTDGDQDGKCLTLVWKNMFDRVTRYTDTMTSEFGARRQLDESAFLTAAEQNVGAQATARFPNSTGVLFLLIRVSCFGSSSVGFDPNVDGSFDFDVKHNYTVVNTG